VISFLVLGGFVAIPPVQGEEIAWRLTEGEAASEAAMGGIPMFVLITAGDWCDPCRWLNSNTLRDAPVARVINNSYIPLFYTDGNPEASRYRADRLPTIVILDSEGSELDRVSGAVSSSMLLTTLAAHVSGESANWSPVAAADKSLSSAVFRLGNVGTLWNDGSDRWFSQDAGLPPRMEQYDQDDTFVYIRDRGSATLIGIPRETASGATTTLWQWDVQRREWRQMREMVRLD
jgi:hypothetical protein